MQKTRLLLTGGCGFIGHYVVEGVLEDTDWEIVILDSLTYAGDLNRIKGIPERVSDVETWEKLQGRVKFVFHDLRADISESVHRKIGKVDYVWHLSAESHVSNSLKDCLPFIESNVLGTTHLVRYLKNYQPDLKKYVYFSSDEVFGAVPDGVYNEEGSTCNPSSPYAASKEGGEAISKAFAFSYGLPTIITRTTNVFGKRQDVEKFVPKSTRAILKGERITIHGTPATGFSSRHWLYARNIPDALIFLMDQKEIINKDHQHDKQYGIYHIVGEEDEKTVVELADIIKKVAREAGIKYDKEYEYIEAQKARPGHDLKYAISGKKLAGLGYRPRFSFDDNFEKVIAWMIRKENRHWLGL